MKKLLALVLALVMVLSVTAAASASPIKLEKHPYEKPNRELPYETWQTVPDSIATPNLSVKTDWDANVDPKTGKITGKITVRFGEVDSVLAADLINNMDIYHVNNDGSRGEAFSSDERKFTMDTKTGELLLNFDKADIDWLKKNEGGKFMLASNAFVPTLDKDNKWDYNKGDAVQFELTYEWDDKTDSAALKKYTIKNHYDEQKYSTDGVAVSEVEYYPNGKCKSVTLQHVDGDNRNNWSHDYTDDDHTDHRYDWITLNYDEKTGKLTNYEYWTENDYKDALTADNYTMSAAGDVLKAIVNVKGIDYEYKTLEYYTQIEGLKASQVTTNMLGWFMSYQQFDEKGNAVVDAQGNYVYVTVPCAAPEGYEKGFKDTVHLFAKRHWYPKNTIGVVGLSLRDEYPGLTDKWINIVPVDLTIQGTQTIELVAGNMFHIGKAFVDVDGDNVTVTYSYTNNVTEAFSECVKWFKNVDEITTEFCENPTSETVFGQPVSIANDLGGQEVALLYICNSATYYQTFITTQDAPNRYYENLKKWREKYRPALYELMEKIPE